MRIKWQIAMVSGIATSLAVGFGSKAWLSTEAPTLQPLEIKLLGSSNLVNEHAICFGITNVSSRPHHIYFPQIRGGGRGNCLALQKSILNPGEGLLEVAHSGRDYSVWQLTLHSVASYSQTEQWRVELARRVKIPILTRWFEPEVPKPVVSKGPFMIRNTTFSIPEDL